jgi:hypothetical protein
MNHQSHAPSATRQRVRSPSRLVDAPSRQNPHPPPQRGNDAGGVARTRCRHATAVGEAGDVAGDCGRRCPRAALTRWWLRAWAGSGRIRRLHIWPATAVFRPRSGRGEGASRAAGAKNPRRVVWAWWEAGIRQQRRLTCVYVYARVEGLTSAPGCPKLAKPAGSRTSRDGRPRGRHPNKES